MQVFNRHVSARGLTVFGFETVLITGAILLAAQMHGSFDDALGSVWQVVLITALCELCFYYNDLYDLTVVHSTTELVVRILQGAGAAAIVLAVLSRAGAGACSSAAACSSPRSASCSSRCRRGGWRSTASRAIRTSRSACSSSAPARPRAALPS